MALVDDYTNLSNSNIPLILNYYFKLGDIGQGNSLSRAIYRETIYLIFKRLENKI